MRQKHISALALVAFLFVMAFSSPDARAQCKAFVKSSCLPQLVPYIHDGSYQAVMMSEGEEAEVYKTIFAGQQYRLFICTDTALPNVEFVVSDIHRNILFDNRKNGNVKMWDFKSDASQQIKVTIRIPKSKKQDAGEQEIVFGCVGVLFGLLDQ
ncbi:MAG: hypothetical protein LBL24_01450 [Bacteroidales bacterium]|jgi:hypothetical protein|nr:hypothetical protein [Bacteroidales bacterium]